MRPRGLNEVKLFDPLEDYVDMGLECDAALTPESLTFENSSLEPLKDFTSKMTILEGIGMLASEVNGVGYVGHEASALCCFTGSETRTIGDDEDYLPTGPSLDRILGQELGADSVQRSIQLGVGCTVGTWFQDTISYDESGNRLPGIDSAREAFSALFGNVTGGGSGEAAARELAKKKSVVDAIRASAMRMRSRLAAPEAQKIDQHMDALADIERRLTATTMTPITCGEPMAPTRDPSADGNSMDEHTSVMFDIVAQALACDRTRFMSTVWGVNTGAIPWLFADVDGWHDQIAHVIANKGSDFDDARLVMAGLTRWYAEQIAGLMRRLDSVQEGDGTVLDNTLIVWAQDFGHQSHGGLDVPYILLGGAQNKFRMGRYISYYNAVEDQFDFHYPKNFQSNNKLLVAILQAFGLDRNTINAEQYTGVLDGVLA
jgi:hypothetical protein